MEAVLKDVLGLEIGYAGGYLVQVVFMGDGFPLQYEHGIWD